MSPDIRAISALIRRAAQVAADYQQGIDRSSVSREYKQGAQDIVTVHDTRSEALIREVLTEAMPEATIVGEEDGTTSGSSQLTFFVDPIDGTSNFAAGLPLFAISIGAAIGDDLVAGVVHAPALGYEFWSDDTGAYLGETPLEPRPTRPLRDSVILTSFPSWRDATEFPELAADSSIVLKREANAVRSLGSAAIELAFVAAGWADAAMLASIKPWDVAAGFHLVRQAGGSVRTWSGETGSTDGGPSEQATGSEGERPQHLCPAYVACAGPERLTILDDIHDQIHTLRASRARNDKETP